MGFEKKSVLEVVNLFELNEVDSIRYGLKMTNFCHHLTQNWMTGFQKRPFLEVDKLFELNEVDLIRCGLKMTNFCHLLTKN